MANISPEVRNYFKLDLLLRRLPDPVRELFKNRYSQYNGGQLWDSTSVCGTSFFDNVIKKSKDISLTKTQKASVMTGNLNEWDLSTLTNILLYAKSPATLSPNEIQQRDQENQILTQLKDIRNEAAHRASKSFSDTEFNQMWTDLTRILVAFGGDDTELDKLKDDSIFEPPTEDINEINVEEAKRLNSLGTQAHKNGQFSEAITYFTKAIVLPAVATRDRACFFSNMAGSRLGLYDQQAGSTKRYDIDGPTDERYRALQDAKKARSLWPSWWKGHFRVGKVYVALNEQERAINSFERASALEPTNDDVKKALNESRFTLDQQQRQAHLDADYRPKSIFDQLREKQQKLGLNPEEVHNAYRLFQKKNPSLSDVENGYRYEHGDDDVKQNYEQAARYFAKAAGQGNPEGMYNLARLTDRGLGVKKDHTLAQNLYEQAAAKPPYLSELYNVRNNGVAEAEHALGLRYVEGIVVSKNQAVGSCWFKRAFDHGHVQSGNNLASLYENGSGVILDLDKAEHIYEQAAQQGDSNAMYNLAILFTRRVKFERAKIWYNRARDAGHIVAQADRGFEADLEAKQSIYNQISPDMLQITDKIFELFSSIKNTTSSSTESDESNPYEYHTLLKHANRGSKTARIMCDAQEHFIDAIYPFMVKNSFTEDEENFIIHNLAQSYRLEYIVAASYPSLDIHDKVVDLVDRVLRRCGSSVSQLDEDARTCYGSIHSDAHTLVNTFLGPCKQKYPKSFYFFELSAAKHGSLREYDNALYNANLGLEIDPHHCGLLYDRAGALRLLRNDMDEAIQAYRTFLATAPQDHRKVPDAYYAMAMCYIEVEHSLNLEKATEMYKKGEEAEKLQLPCFLPYDPSIKDLVKHQLELFSTIKTKLPNHRAENEARLENPGRIEIIVEQRRWQNHLLQSKGKDVIASGNITQGGRFSQRTASSLIGLMPITFREMNQTEDHVYQRYVLSVTVIGEAYGWAPSIHLVTEDEHRDCKKICIYGFPEDQGEYLIKKVFRIGSKMNILNPYLRIGASDKKPIIRVDEYASIMMQSEDGYVVNMCRCCGQANASHNCGKCKRARYCSKECQRIDWELYEHKLICIRE
ncbi:unnamed protein product [Adineta ricciae]|uniref:MYND-type domain-containing protein n=1 Tax=Adineta ricciae TaxID=249248 RepID=A0A814TK56_ADIRI|nr:unnamed protein product [Adineta ricciae]